jgi:hypothetical protein
VILPAPATIAQTKPGPPLPFIEAPDDAVLAHAKAVEFFRIERERQNKVLVMRAS